MANRQPGWYHVKNTRSGWECAQWNGYSWHGVFLNDAPDDVWAEIGPRIPTPDEDYVTMPRSVYDMLFSAGEQTIDRIDRTWSHGELSDAPKPGGE